MPLWHVRDVRSQGQKQQLGRERDDSPVYIFNQDEKFINRMGIEQNILAAKLRAKKTM